MNTKFIHDNYVEIDEYIPDDDDIILDKDDIILNDVDTYDDNSYDADDSEFEFTRNIQLHQMEKTIWFKEMSLHPVNIAEMKYFIKSLDLLNAFSIFDVNKVLNFTPKKLDCLFITLKTINIFVVEYCEYVIRNFFIPEFKKIFDDHLTTDNTISLSSSDVIKPRKCINRSESIRVFLEEFYLDQSLYFVRVIKYYQYIKDKNRLRHYSKRMMSKCIRLLDSDYYDYILNKLNISTDTQFIENNIDCFKKITQQVIEYTDKYLFFLENIDKIVEYFIDEDTNEDELLNYIENNFEILKFIDAHSDVIEDFSMLMIDQLTEKQISETKVTKINEYDNFLYSKFHKDTNVKYAFWKKPTKKNDMDEYCSYWNNFSSKRLEAASKKLNDLNLRMYPETAMRDILEPFVINNLVTSTSELITMIINIMETKRKEPGIFSKYDQIDLETAYMLVSLGNNLNDNFDSYDDFLSKIKENQCLPAFYSVEFILRLVARVLDVQIILYQRDMTRINFDNVLYYSYNQSVMIYQHNISEFFVLHNLDTEFIPLRDNNTIVDKPTIMENKTMHSNVISIVPTIKLPMHGDVISIGNRKIKIYEI